MSVLLPCSLSFPPSLPVCVSLSLALSDCSSSVSLYTLDHANDILTALRSTGTPLDVNLINRTALRSTGTPLDVNLINRTALLAQETAREAIDRADRINSTLGDVVSQVISSARQLSQRGSDSLGTSDGGFVVSWVVDVYCEMAPH